ncbi:MAG: fasciclin domain-containing protein, partial [Flavobacteriales bacterium]
VGDTVVWINDGGTHDVNGNINTITGNSFDNPESFDSPSTSTVGATIYTHVFNIEGTYNYDCSVGNHALQGMVGTIIVNSGLGSVVDIIVNSENHNTLETAVIEADLAATLSGDGPFTVFAPTDAAFDALPDGVLDQVLADNDVLTAILLHHVHSGNALSTDLSDGMEVPTLNDDILTVSIDGEVVMIDMATVTVADIIASNGVVHVIDMVLLPATDDQTVMSIIANSPAHTILEEAVLAAELDGTLSGDGPFTVFAPSDDAFDGLPAGALDLILANTEQLTDLLLNHVHSGNVLSTDLSDGMMVPTLNETELTVSIDGMTVMIDLATVTQADLVASNGVVHVIDKVLLPDFGQEDTTVYSIIKASPIHTTLEAAIDAAELGETLSGDGPFTVFAPTDDAFDALPAGALDDLLADIPLLTEILLHHVHSGNVLSTDLSNGMEVPTLNDDVLIVSIDAGSVMIDMSTVIQPDIVANNGVVHVINAVLVADDEPTTINTFLNEKDVEYLYTINLLGELVDRDSKEKILVDIYSNGTSIKRYNLRK